MAMPVAHRLSQSGQWQHLQSQWEQQQQQMQQHDNHHRSQHDPYYHPQQQPYNDYYHNDHGHHTAYSSYPAPPPLAVPPLLLRIAVSPTQTEDLPIDVVADTDVPSIARQFCQAHGVSGESKLQKLQAMIERSVEQHRQQHVTVQPTAYYPPYTADSQYEQQPYGGGYYDEQQAYAEQYGGQYGLQPMATVPSPNPSQLSGAESEELSPLQPTFTPSRPTSALSHTAAIQHSRHESNATPAQHFSHSQPTPSLRPSSLTLPSSSSSPSPRFSSSSPRPISPHTAGYLNAPASARLYANAAVKQRQLVRHQQQKQQLDDERQQQELQHCTFTPQLTHSRHSSSERRRGRRQYEWIEDWNGEKRERRLERMRETEKKRLKEEECSFTPTVNAVSHQLVQLNKANPSKKTKDTQLDDRVKLAKPAQQVLDKEAKAKIARFLHRTIERQQLQKQALARLQENNLKQITPSFVPSITPKAQAVQPTYNRPAATVDGSNNGGGTTGSIVPASVKKRQRRCDEIYRCFADSDGYIDRSGWMRLVKAWYMHDSVGGSGGGGGSGRLERMRWQLEMDDVAVIQMVIKECDRQVRRDRKAGKGWDGMGDSEGCTWQLSLADFQLWNQRLWHVVLTRAQTAEKEEARMVHKFIPTPDP